MPISSPQAPLRAAVTSTFEDLGFLFPERVETLPPTPGRVAAVTFHGPVPGRLELFVSAELLPVLAANMLGIGEAPALALQEDALREMANVVCGNVVPALAGAAAVVHLDAPTLLPDTTSPAVDATARLPRAGEASGPVAREAFRFDEGSAVATVVLLP